MTEMIKLSAGRRTEVGTGSARALRREGRVPAIIYGGEGANENISLPLKEFNLQYQKGSFNTKLVELDLDGKKVTVLPKKVELHVVTDVPQHVDFIRVGKDTMVRVSVNVKILNEDKSIGIKRGGVVNIVHRSIDLLCHPGKIPNHINIDIGGLDIGHNLHISSVELPEGVKPADTTDFTVVSVTGRASDEEKEQVATTDAAATPAAAAGATPAKGAAPAKAGAAAPAPQKKK